MRKDFSGDMQANQVVEQNVQDLTKKLKDIIKASPEKKAKLKYMGSSLINDDSPLSQVKSNSDSYYSEGESERKLSAAKQRPYRRPGIRDSFDSVDSKRKSMK